MSSMNSINLMEKLLDGVEVEWKRLDEIAEIKRGTSITKRDVVEGDIPVIAGGRTPAYYHNESNREGQTIVIAGSGAYAGFVSWWEQPIFVSDAFTVKPSDSLSTRYCYHFLLNMQQQLHEFKSGGGVPHVYPRDIAPIKIPIPCPDNPAKSLEIQSEIVHILDTFTDLTAELTAELFARKKQYEHYREKLLSFEEGSVEWMALGSLVKTITAPSKLKTVEYRDMGKLPIIDQGIGFIAGYTDESIAPVKPGEYVIFGDHSEHIKYVDFSFVQGADGIKILSPTSNNAKYIYYAFQNLYKKELSYKRHWSNAKETLIPIPCPERPQKSLEIQAEIVRILDTFTDMTTELNAELAARQKQYEYYRELLLSFPVPPSEQKSM